MYNSTIKHYQHNPRCEDLKGSRQKLAVRNDVIVVRVHAVEHRLPDIHYGELGKSKEHRRTRRTIGLCHRTVFRGVFKIIQRVAVWIWMDQKRSNLPFGDDSTPISGDVGDGPWPFNLDPFPFKCVVNHWKMGLSDPVAYHHFPHNAVDLGVPHFRTHPKHINLFIYCIN